MLAQVEWLGWVVAAALLVVGGVILYSRRGRGARVQILSVAQSMKSVGELVVFKIIAKEIVTSSDHWLKDFGRKYLAWLVSEKKVALIFEFEIDFRYDLRSPEFTVRTDASDELVVSMPPCFYEVNLKGQKYYDEQESLILPSLLPRILSGLAGGKFTEEDRNKLFEEARKAAEKLAMDYITQLKSEVEKSARQTLETMARNLGVENVRVEFRQNDLEKAPIIHDVRPTPAELEADA